MSTPPTALESLDESTPEGARQYGQISSELRSAQPSERVALLAGHGLTESRWQAVATTWTRTLTDEIARGGHDLLLAYAGSFRETERGLRAAPRDAKAATMPATTEATPEVPLVVVTPALATFQQQLPTEVVVSSAVHSSTTGSAGWGPHPEFGATTDTNLALLGTPAVPFAPAALPTLSPAEPTVFEVARFAELPAVPPGGALGATTDVNLSKLVMPALPFGMDPPAMSAPKASPPPGGLGETTDADLNQVLRSVVPFSPAAFEVEPSSGPQPALALNATVPTDFSVFKHAAGLSDNASQARQPLGRPHQAFAETTDVNLGAILEAVLSEREGADRATMELDPPQTKSTQPALGGTMQLPVQPDPSPALPFAASASDRGLPDLTLEQYARLCVELEVPVGRPEETLSRFGIADAATLTKLHEAWQTRFAKDPSLSELWQALRAQHRAHYSQKPA